MLHIYTPYNVNDRTWPVVIIYTQNEVLATTYHLIFPNHLSRTSDALNKMFKLKANALHLNFQTTYPAHVFS